MTSKILIDVDSNSDPVIRISGNREWHESDDVRDKLIKGFIENVGTRNALVSIYFDDNGDAILKPAALDYVLHQLLVRFKSDSKSHNLISEIIENEFGALPVINEYLV